VGEAEGEGNASAAEVSPQGDRPGLDSTESAPVSPQGVPSADQPGNQQQGPPPPEGGSDDEGQDGFAKPVAQDEPVAEPSGEDEEDQAKETRVRYSDAEGDWKLEQLEKMEQPGDVGVLVDRRGKALDAAVAEKFYQASAKQEQVIKRLNALKKDLDALFLPTDHLDELAVQMAANLDRLQERPDPEGFKRQAKLLEQLGSTVIVFRRPTSQQRPSLPREQRVRGRILDEPAWPTPTGYERAVSRYYRKLAGDPPTQEGR
jgi:hypothetical protein